MLSPIRLGGTTEPHVHRFVPSYTRAFFWSSFLLLSRAVHHASTGKQPNGQRQTVEVESCLHLDSPLQLDRLAVLLQAHHNYFFLLSFQFPKKNQ